MSAPVFQLLSIGASALDPPASAFGRFRTRSCADLAGAAQRLRKAAVDAVLVRCADADAVQALIAWPSLSHAVLDAAVVCVSDAAGADQAVQLLHMGVQDVLPENAARGEALARVLRLAIERKGIERAARRAHALDLATGLPNHAQLLEHMTHLLALREREPAPMALLALRLDGLCTVAATLGAEAANVLRRKAAVRLRAGLRASDVVAAIGGDTFAVLLAWIDAPTDAPAVASKLSLALQQPYTVAAQQTSVAVSVGLSQYPQHGTQADELLRRALGQAGAATAEGRTGMANFVERGPSRAANDEES